MLKLAVRIFAPTWVAPVLALGCFAACGPADAAASAATATSATTATTSTGRPNRDITGAEAQTSSAQAGHQRASLTHSSSGGLSCEVLERIWNRLKYESPPYDRPCLLDAPSARAARSLWQPTPNQTELSQSRLRVLALSGEWFPEPVRMSIKRTNPVCP